MDDENTVGVPLPIDGDVWRAVETAATLHRMHRSG